MRIEGVFKKVCPARLEIAYRVPQGANGLVRPRGRRPYVGRVERTEEYVSTTKGRGTPLADFFNTPNQGLLNIYLKWPIHALDEINISSRGE